MNIVARGVVHRLRTEVFDALIRVPKQVIDRYTHGELVSKLTFNVEQVSGASSEALKTVIRDGLTVGAGRLHAVSQLEAHAGVLRGNPRHRWCGAGGWPALRALQPADSGSHGR